MTTDMDTKREEAKKHLEKAYQTVLELINPETEGYAGYTNNFIDNLHETTIGIRKLIRNL